MEDKTETIITLIWLILVLPILPIFIPATMFYIGFSEHISNIVQHFLIGVWIFVAMMSALFTMYGVSTMDRIKDPVGCNSYYNTDKIMIIIIITVSIVVAYYGRFEI